MVCIPLGPVSRAGFNVNRGFLTTLVFFSFEGSTLTGASSATKEMLSNYKAILINTINP